MCKTLKQNYKKATHSNIWNLKHLTPSGYSLSHNQPLRCSNLLPKVAPPCLTFLSSFVGGARFSCRCSTSTGRASTVVKKREFLGAPFAPSIRPRKDRPPAPSGPSVAALEVAPGRERCHPFPVVRGQWHWAPEPWMWSAIARIFAKGEGPPVPEMESYDSRQVSQWSVSDRRLVALFRSSNQLTHAAVRKGGFAWKGCGSISGRGEKSVWVFVDRGGGVCAGWVLRPPFDCLWTRRDITAINIFIG